MKTTKMQIVTGVLQVIWSLPIIGIVLVVHPLYPVIMSGLHGVTIGLATKEQKRKVGNILGLIASLLAIKVAINMRAFSGLGSGVELLVIWPIHILSAIYIFIDLSKNKKWEEISR